ncbi:MAG: sugar ABC transporter permease [Spirochaetia bacterium]|nr:sugar ABC transporter permease [Spirochaetia bacterium]
MKSQKIYGLFVLPAVISYTLFWVFPVAVGFFYSLTDWNGIRRSYSLIGGRNYLRILQDSRFLDSLGFTLHYTVLLVIAINLLALVIASLLNGRLRGTRFYRSLFFFPAVLSMVTVGLIFNQIFYHVIPWIGDLLQIPLLQTNLLADQDTAEYGVLLVNIWQGTAIPIILYLAGLQSVPKELYEVAQLEGAGVLQRFSHVTFPFIIPVISMNLVVTLKSGLMVFDYIAALTDGGPGRATESMAFLIYTNAFKEMKFSYAVTESFVIFLLITVISIVQIRLLGRREAHA